MADIVVRHEKLRAGIAGVLRASGSDEREARIVTDHLVEANLKGHDSHGVGMVPQYVRHIGEGKLKLNRTDPEGFLFQITGAKVKVGE
jgi:uncharacterized oxidoreductase